MRWGHLTRILALLACGFPLSGRADQQTSLKQARIFFDELEFVKCVQVADAAAPDPERERERAELELIAGLCEANLGRLDVAQARFRIALRFAADLELPAGTSPKIEGRFVQAQRQVNELNRPATEPVVTPVETPQPVVTPPVEPEQPVVSNPVTPGLPGEQAPVEPPKAQTRIAAIALGLAAGGAAAAGVWFGIQASNVAARANTAPFDSDNFRLGKQARDQALAANLFYAGAALAGGAAIVVLIIRLP